jgi:hypothetical protein
MRAITPRLSVPLLLATVAAFATLATAPSAHAAAPMNCDASALRLTLLGQAIEPITVNRGQTACKKAASPTTIDLSSLGIPLTAGVLSAQTNAGGSYEKQAALASGGVLNLGLAKLPALQLPDLTTLLPESLKKISVPLGPISTTANAILLLLPPPLNIQLPASIEVDLGAAIKDLLNPLPDVSVLSAGTLNAYAGATCVAGVAKPFGVPQIADVSVLGQSLGVDGLVNSALQILNTQSIDLSKLDLSKLVLPKVISDLGLNALTQPVLNLVDGLLKQVLSALPPIQIPAAVADVSVKPGVQTIAAGVLTQHALDVHIALLGQTLIDGVIGEARVNTTGVDCSPAATPAPTSASDLALQCTTRKLVLTDVYQSGDRVRLIGAADKKLVGKTVTIRFEADGTTAAQTAVQKDGSFTTTAPLPAKQLRSSNRARYKASIGSEKSLNLKLARRMVVTKLASAKGKVTIAGYVTRPLGRPVQPISVQRRVSCSKNVTVKTLLPQSDGRFSVTVDAPEGQSAAVYRLASKVRKNTTNSKLFATFTLPRGVNLRQ